MTGKVILKCVVEKYIMDCIGSELDPFAVF
jgi:hypothetical protein